MELFLTIRHSRRSSSRRARHNHKIIEQVPCKQAGMLKEKKKNSTWNIPNLHQHKLIKPQLNITKMLLKSGLLGEGVHVHVPNDIFAHFDYKLLKEVLNAEAGGRESGQKGQSDLPGLDKGKLGMVPGAVSKCRLQTNEQRSLPSDRLCNFASRQVTPIYCQ